MTQYQNNHLREVACTFNFKKNEKSKKWDSSYFGLFFDKVSNLGFTDKEERKGIQLEFSSSSTEPFKDAKLQEQSSIMIFRNNDDKSAVIVGENLVSINKVGNYTNWEDFLNNYIIKYYKLFVELGLQYEILNCQVVYLNNFNLPNSNLSNYFNLVSKFESNGKENLCNIQRNFIVDNKVAVICKLFANRSEENWSVNLECGALSINKFENASIEEICKLVNYTKMPINNIFEQVITQELRRTL